MATICWQSTSMRVARVVGGLDLARLHPLDHDGRLEQVGPVLREQLAAARRAHLVAGPADALEPAGDRPRRLDLHDEVHRAHVDAELEAGRGDQALEPAGLQVVLDLEPALARQRAVVRLHQLLVHRRRALRLGGAVLALPVELVEAGGQPLGQAAGVHEDERGAVLLHQLEEPRVHGRPDRPARRARRRRTGGRAPRSRCRARPCRRPG